MITYAVFNRAPIRALNYNFIGTHNMTITKVNASAGARKETIVMERVTDLKWVVARKLQSLLLRVERSS